MKTKLMAMVLMAGSTMFAGVRFGVAVNVGPGHAIIATRPPCPGPGYVWIDGYTDAYGRWINGYWGAPPYAGAYWVGPSYAGGRFVAGYWGGERRFEGHRFEARHFDARPDAHSFRR